MDAARAQIRSGGVVVVGPELLEPVGTSVRAEAAVGAATVVRVEGEVRARAEIRAFLRHLGAFTIAVTPSDPGCDLWTTDPPTADGWVQRVLDNPRTCLAAAFLARRTDPDVWDGLVAESATYSTLQAGPDFQAWLASAERPTPPGDPGVRARATPLPGQPVCEVTLTRPSRHNALDVLMREELLGILDALYYEPATAIALLGEGPSFCSGGDLAEFGTAANPADAHVVRLRRSLARRFAQLGGRMVAGLHGAALGAGLELAAFAGHVVAADDTKMGLPEVRLGLIPGAGGTVSVRRRAGRRRMLELVVTGEPVGAETALRWGLVDEVVPRESLPDRVRQRARELARRL